MHIHRMHSRDEFMARRPVGMLVRVIRVPTAGRRERPDGRLIPLPGVHFSYSFIVGDHAWVYDEKLIGDANPAIIDLKDTLWAELERTGEYYLYPCARSF